MNLLPIFMAHLKLYIYIVHVIYVYIYIYTYIRILHVLIMEGPKEAGNMIEKLNKENLGRYG